MTEFAGRLRERVVIEQRQGTAICSPGRPANMPMPVRLGRR